MGSWNHETFDKGSASVPRDGEQENARTVRVSVLVMGDSLRSEGVNADHARVLAESSEHLPPILVHRRTMRVIDGLHRVLAAKLLGRETIDVQFFDGDEDEAFVRAVQANIAHGLPLTLADRTAAAARVMRTHAQWSDRRIAAVVGLSPKTVGAVRRRSTEEIPQSRVRLGRDGRLRRLPDRRPQPEATGGAGGEGTASDGSPALGGRPAPLHKAPRISRVSAPQQAAPHRAAETVAEYLTRYQTLCQDPSFRQTEAGRFLLRLLELHFVREREWERLIANVPPHQADSVADLARECAKAWLEFADRAEQQSSATTYYAI